MRTIVSTLYQKHVLVKWGRTTNGQIRFLKDNVTGQNKFYTVFRSLNRDRLVLGCNPFIRNNLSVNHRKLSDSAQRKLPEASFHIPDLSQTLFCWLLRLSPLNVPSDHIPISSLVHFNANFSKSLQDFHKLKTRFGWFDVWAVCAQLGRNWEEANKELK